MELHKQVVSLELAKKLKRLGVRQASHFSWHTGGRLGGERFTDQLLPTVRPPEFGSADSAWEDFAAFTVAEVEALLPEEINIAYKNGKRRDDNHWLKYQRVWNGYRARYSHSRYSSDSWLEAHADTFADALAMLLIMVLERELMSSGREAA